MRTDEFNRFSARIEDVTADRMDVFHHSVRQHNSELVDAISSLAQGLLDGFGHPVAILWMDALQHHLASRRALLRIEAPDSEIFL